MLLVLFLLTDNFIILLSCLDILLILTSLKLNLIRKIRHDSNKMEICN